MQMILPAALENLGHDPAAQELAHGRPRAQELAGEVNADDFVPLGQRHVLEGGVVLQPGVVDEDVHRAPFWMTWANIASTCASSETSAR